MAVEAGKLALYEGTRESDLVNEDIDERILEILGLEELYDFTYGEYKQLLFSELQRVNRGEEKSTDRAMLIQDEFKRVKNKIGKFKIKKKKITAEIIGVTGPIKVSKEKFFLAGKAVIPEVKEPPLGKNVKKSLEDISSTLDTILHRLLVQNQYAKTSAETERKKEENIGRRKKESDLEKSTQRMISLATKMLAPVQNILDSIFKFIFSVLLGRAFVKITKWFADPKNKKKIETLKKFLKDWWPSILGAFVLFATPFGKFVRSTIATLARFTPKLLSLIKANPLTNLIVSSSVAGTISRTKEREKLKPLLENQRKIIEKEEKNQNLPWYKSFGNFFAKQELTTGQNKQSIVAPSPGAMYSSGGTVSGFSGLVTEGTGIKVSGAGQDTQAFPIEGGGTGILKKGEIVMNTDAVNAIGRDRLLSWNRVFGGPGANKPISIGNGVEAHRTGGVIGSSGTPRLGMGFLNRTFAALQGANRTSKNQQPLGSGILNQLGRVIPGTGSVVSPRYTEMGLQNKFLGIPLNRSVIDQEGGYRLSPKVVDRYNQSPTSPSIIRPWSAFDSTQVSFPKPNSAAPTSTSVVRDSFRNFGSNVQTIRDSAKRQELEMGKLGIKPDGYVNLRGQPINLGPQSKLSLPGPPTGGGVNVSVIQLPDVVRNIGPTAHAKGSTTVPNIPDQYSINQKINKSIYGIA